MRKAWTVVAVVLLACSEDKPLRGGVIVDDHPGHGGGGGEENPGGVGGGDTGGEGGAPGGEGGAGGEPEGGAGGEGGTVAIDPWPAEDRFYGAAEGLPGQVTGVGIDDGQNVYAIDGEAIYALRAGTGAFVRTTGIGQFAYPDPVFTVCGGEAGQVYAGFMASELDPFHVTEEQKLEGDVDRYRLNEDGTLELEFHYQLQNSNARWMDHTRMIFDCARVVGGPTHGDLLIASNHGATLIRGDEFADHRHVLFVNSAGSQAIGWNYGANTDSAGNLWWAGWWKLAALPPTGTDSVMRFVDYEASVYFVNTYPMVWGSEEEPDQMSAVAADPVAQQYWVGSRFRGLAEAAWPRQIWREVPGTPDLNIRSLEWDASGGGDLWVGTDTRGLWRWHRDEERWEQHPYVPGDARVYKVLLDETVTPRAVYAATSRGLFVIRSP